MSYIFLTGATGNVGQLALNELVRRGYDVVALVRRPTELLGCETVVGDLEHIEAVADHVADARAVLHLASPRADERGSVIAADIAGTGALLDGWRYGNFVYASSQTVYGIPRGPLAEDAPVDTLCWYDWGKLCNEFQLRAATATGAAPGAAVSLRLALLFGSGSRRHDRQFLPLIYEHCLQEGLFVFDSEQTLDQAGSSFIGDRDLGRAVVDSLSIETSGSYNVAGAFCTWQEMLTAFGEAMGCRIRIAVGRDAAATDALRLPQSRSFLEMARFERASGFHPEQTVDEVVERFVRAEQQLSPQRS